MFSYREKECFSMEFSSANLGIPEEYIEVFTTEKGISCNFWRQFQFSVKENVCWQYAQKLSLNRCPLSLEIYKGQFIYATCTFQIRRPLAGKIPTVWIFRHIQAHKLVFCPFKLTLFDQRHRYWKAFSTVFWVSMYVGGEFIFWQRATLKGPKRSFDVLVVLVLVLGVESSSKNVRGNKNVPGNKKCSAADWTLI